MIETAVAFRSGGLSDSIASFNFQGPVAPAAKPSAEIPRNYVVFDQIADGDACNRHVLFARVGVHRSFPRNLVRNSWIAGSLE